MPSATSHATVEDVELAKGLAENLSEGVVTRRLRGGIIMLMVALGLAAAFEVMDAGPITRLWLFVPFFLAENVFFQAVHKTCGFSALRGLRHTADGDERIVDPKEREAVMKRGWAQLAQTGLAATLITALFVWIG